MTKKDFELIARMINSAACETKLESSEYGRGCRTQRTVIAGYFAAALADANPRFDRPRFMRACGVDE